MPPRPLPLRLTSPSLGTAYEYSEGVLVLNRFRIWGTPTHLLFFRWLKSLNISMASECQQQSLAQELTGGVAGEYALFSSKKRGEEFHKAAFVWVEHLEQKIVDTLDHNDRLECIAT